MKKCCFYLIRLVLFTAAIHSPVAARVYINELLALNGSVNLDPDFYDFTDWIELYNDSTASVELSNWYLSDNPDSPYKWRVPLNTSVAARGYIVLWADGKDSALHANFKLSADGEKLLLFKPDRSLVDSVTFPAQVADRSFGRSPVRLEEWCYFDLPSQGVPNSQKVLAINAETAEAPQFSAKGGFYQQPFYLTLNAGNQDDTIRYTTNGAVPGPHSPQYTTPIHITKSTVIRANVFCGSRYNSPVITHSFFIDTLHHLPVVSLVTHPEYLWNDTFGIYTIGTNGIPGLYDDTGNYNRDWKRPVNVELYKTDGDIGFNEGAEVEIAGLASRRTALKGMNISFKKRYGKSEIDYPLYNSKKNSRLKDFVLRNSGGYDLAFTHFRDGLMNTIVANMMDIDYQAYQPAVVYLNGEYWGILNIREKVNENYTMINHNANPDNVDYLEYYNEVILHNGDLDHYNELIEYVSMNNCNSTEAYRYLESKIDLQEFINYHIAQIYFLNTDWPGNNVKMWRPKNDRGKWRWMLSDVEIGFNLHETPPEMDGISRLLNPVESGGWNFPWATQLFRKCMSNESIRTRFIQTFAYYVASVFDTTRVLRQIDSLQNVLQPEFPAHIARWKNVSMEQWNRNVEVLRDFARKRPAYCMQHLKSNFALQDAVPVRCIVSPRTWGKIEINDQEVSTDTFNCLFFKNLPVTLKAVPNAGYHFIGWSGNVNATDDSIVWSADEASVITAEFSSNLHEIVPQRITGNHYLTLDKSPCYATHDIVVETGATLFVEPGVTIFCGDSVSFYVYGSLQFVGEENNPIILKPDSISNARALGSLCFFNTVSPSRLCHVGLEKMARSRSDSMDAIASVTAFSSDLLIDNVFIESYNQPFYAEYGSSTITASTFRTRATCDLINVKYGRVLVENCDLKGNYSVDTDAIDFDGVDSGTIRGNRIYGFLGENSDGIDLGEGSKNIRIQDNRIENCSDKGISIGQASTATIERNTIVRCNLGIGIKDRGSTAWIDRNTFHDNNIGIACFEKNVGAGGGKAEVVNCILSQSEEAPVTVDGLSELSVSYSMTTGGTLPGNNNQTQNPLFTSSATGEFLLRQDSPCIDAGDPASTLDPDYSVADMGAHCYFRQITINEINYSNGGQINPGDWIELVHTGLESINVDGWSLLSPENGWKAVITDDRKIQPGNFCCIAGDKERFLNEFPNGEPLEVNTEFTLDDSGETLLLLDKNGRTIDSVSYTNGSPWPKQDIRDRGTLSLCSISSDNALPYNWKITSQPGTPGRLNELPVASDNIVINEINYHSSALYDSEDWVELYNRGQFPIDLSGWVLTDDNMSHRFVFQGNVVVDPESFLVVCRNQNKFSLFYSDVWNYLGDIDFGLGSQGDMVRLIDHENKTVDSVSYGNSSPWPTGPDGTGATLELMDPYLENSLPDSWRASTGLGTPGKENSTLRTIESVPPGLPVRSELLFNQSNLNNPGKVIINYSVGRYDNGVVSIAVFNLAGRLVDILVNRKQQPGFYRIPFNTAARARGTYLLRLRTKRSLKTKKLILVN